MSWERDEQLGQLVRERDAAQAEAARLRAIIERAVDWWLRQGRGAFSGAPEWVFAARDVLGSGDGKGGSLSI
jgi:hypothetical protein